MNAQFWRDYYRTSREKKPSACAQWAAAQHIAPNSSIVDLGCGDGRDSHYFASLGHRVLGVDAHSQASHAPNFRFIAADFEHFCRTQPNLSPDVIYCRFVLHAVDAETQARLLEWSARSLPPWGILIIECRSSAGKPPSDGKPRRLIDAGELVDALLDVNLTLYHYEHRADLAPTENENPICLRVIATP